MSADRRGVACGTFYPRPSTTTVLPFALTARSLARARALSLLLAHLVLLKDKGPRELETQGLERPGEVL